MPKLYFLEYGHVAYQIKENDTCSNMVPYSLPADTLVGSKGQNIFFSESSRVAYQIKGNGA